MALFGSVLGAHARAALTGPFLVSKVDITFVGSLGSLDPTSDATFIGSHTRVCVLATAAAFRGVDEAVDRVRQHLAASGATIDVVAGLDRASAHDAMSLDVLARADVAILVDGAALHARSVWRATPLGAALGTSRLIAIGWSGSVLGATMIDPRGGAPTTGLGLFHGVVVGLATGVEESARTRGLLGGDVLYAQLGPRAVVTYNGHWRADVHDDLVVTRGFEATRLER